MSDQRAAPLSRRLVAGAILVPLLVGALLIGRWVVHTRTPYSGTNSVAPDINLAGPAPGHPLCLSGLLIPAGTDRLQLRMAAAAPRPVPMTLRLQAGGRTVVSRAALGAPGFLLVDFPLRPAAHNEPASGCIRVGAKIFATSGHVGTSTNEGQATIDGRGIGTVTIWYLHVPSRRLVSMLPKAADRASLFRAGFVRPWTYLAIGLILVLIWVSAVRFVWRRVQ